MSEEYVSGWGNFRKIRSTVHYPGQSSDVKSANQRFKRYIPKGTGLSYGDSAMHENIVDSRLLNRTIGFDEKAGTFICETGKRIVEVLQEVVPAGYFLGVTPGTKDVTVGGAIAADVHGKNHHKEGCFSEFVKWFDLQTVDGKLLRCSRSENEELFWATCGGMGLTGFIVQACIRLRKIESPFIRNRTIKGLNLNETIKNLLTHWDYTYSVAWVDCTSKKNFGRSLLYLGEHLASAEGSHTISIDYRWSRPLISIPFLTPSWLISRWMVTAVNALRFNSVKEIDSVKEVGLDEYFYPLDKIRNWNRLYGRSGMVQYQVVIPMEHAKTGIPELFGLVEHSKDRPLLTTMKLMGKENEALISFPLHGITVAFDFKVNPSVLDLMDSMDEKVSELNGRSYLAKDVRMSKAFFEKGYPKLERFKAVKGQVDPTGKLSSHQSARLGITFGTKNALILGGNSDIGRAIGEEFARKGFGVVYAVREPSQSDEVKFDATDFKSHEAFVGNLPFIPDVAIVAFGKLISSEDSIKDPFEATETVLVNYPGAVSIIGHLTTLFISNGKGAIVGLSSVAGERGRRSNYVYGSSKAGLTTYLDGLRLHVKDKNVNVISVKPGFVRTKMTNHLDLPKGLTASPDQVAKAVFHAFEKKQDTVYVLPIWRLIMFVIRNIPDFIFRKLSL